MPINIPKITIHQTVKRVESTDSDSDHLVDLGNTWKFRNAGHVVAVHDLWTNDFIGLASLKEKPNNNIGKVEYITGKYSVI